MNKAPATSDAPPTAASSEPGAFPATTCWTETYLRVLAESCQKARAAQAAGQPLPVIVRRRHSDPAFAEREAVILESLGDYLESEAIHRATSRVPLRKVGSDQLLLRLLQIFHPRYSRRQRALQAMSAPFHCSPQRSAQPGNDFDFASRRQRLQFREWERSQAIALALELFHESPELSVPSPSLARSFTSTPVNASQPADSGATTAVPSSERMDFPASKEGSRASAEGKEGRRPAALSPGGAPLPGAEARGHLPASFPPEKGLRTMSGVDLSPEAPSNLAPSQSTPTAHHAPSSASANPTPREKRRRLLWGLALPPGSTPKTPSTVYPGYLPYLIRVGAISDPNHRAPSRPSEPDTS